MCTGALVLGAADLLQGRNATTHWAYATFLERLGARYLPQRWVQDGRFTCSAGVSAGIDMALYLSAKLGSKRVPSITALIRSVLADLSQPGEPANRTAQRPWLAAAWPQGRP